MVNETEATTCIYNFIVHERGYGMNALTNRKDSNSDVRSWNISKSVIVDPV